MFKLTISEKETMFYYRTVNGLQPPIKVMTLGRILVKKWIHLSVQVSKIKNISHLVKHKNPTSFLPFQWHLPSRSEALPFDVKYVPMTTKGK